MYNITKFYITWIIGFIFFPIGLYWIIVFNNPILTIMSFLINGINIILMIKFASKSFERVD